MNIYYVAGVPYTSELYHHGILGQKWGVRRFQYADGTLTAEGRKRYSTGSEQKKLANKLTRHIGKAGSNARTRNINKIASTEQVKYAADQLKGKAAAWNDADREYNKKVDEFYNNKKLYEKYLNKAVDKCIEDMGQDYEEDWVERYGQEGARNKIYELYKYDDLDQGEYSSLELFKKSDEPQAKALAVVEQKKFDAYDNVKRSAEKYADEFLGEYGSKLVTSKGKYGLYSYTSTAKERLSGIIANQANLKASELKRK